MTLLPQSGAAGDSAGSTSRRGSTPCGPLGAGCHVLGVVSPADRRRRVQARQAARLGLPGHQYGLE
jgi:hypothetical protein